MKLVHITTSQKMKDFVLFVDSTISNIKFILFCCHNYSSITNDFYNKMYNRLRNFEQLPLKKLIVKLINFEDYFINQISKTNSSEI